MSTPLSPTPPAQCFRLRFSLSLSCYSQMAAFRVIMSRTRSISKHLSSQNLKNPQPQLIFHRGFSSKLFVKGISFSTTENTLAEAFTRYGEVLEANIVMDTVKNRSKGFGYVTFASVDDAQKALEEMNGKLLDGRIVFVDNARPRHPRDCGIPIARGPPKPADDH